MDAENHILTPRYVHFTSKTRVEFCVEAYTKRTVSDRPAMETAVVKLVSRGFAWRKMNRRSIHTIMQIFTLFEAK